MSLRTTRSRLTALGAGLGLVALTALTGLSGGVTAAAAAPAVTPAAADRPDPVDAIPTPTLDWFRCSGQTQSPRIDCATATVPLDYNDPTGPTTEIALARVRAAKPDQRLGTLFVNPGGPGGAATLLAAYSRDFLSNALYNRFDVVGVDPRGVGFSERVQCLPSFQDEIDVLDSRSTPFPRRAPEVRDWLTADRKVGAACATKPLATHMSTAQVARDMELMRRAVGDEKLTYLGFSYGTYLGQVYAALFPDRFRAIVADGVLDGEAWAGTAANQNQPLEARLLSSEGSWTALRRILLTCDKVGPARCNFSFSGRPFHNLAVLARRLKIHPLVIDEDGFTFTVTYADMVGFMTGSLYSPYGYEDLDFILTELYVMTSPQGRFSSSRRAAASDSVAQIVRTHPTRRPGFAFPYDNSLDIFSSVACTDSVENTRGDDYNGYAIKADQSAPYFGRLWTWGSSLCASDASTGEDPNAYRGPFGVDTTAPVMFVGNWYDPATRYASAVHASATMKNAVLVKSRSYGHTAYGSSDCVTRSVNRYLVVGALPPAGQLCVGDIQPFAQDEGDDFFFRLARQRQRVLEQALKPVTPADRAARAEQARRAARG